MQKEGMKRSVVCFFFIFLYFSSPIILYICPKCVIALGPSAEISDMGIISNERFFPDAINSWNNIIENFQNVRTYTSLKAHVLSLIRPKTKSTFGVHDPLGLRYIFQLRVNLSPLRNHKRRHNFADTPSEICQCDQDIEDTSHFLFECPRYAIPRANLAVTFIGILQRNNLNHLENQLELYIYGHQSN